MRQRHAQSQNRSSRESARRSEERFSPRSFRVSVGALAEGDSLEAQLEKAGRFGHSLDRLNSGAERPGATSEAIVQRTQGKVRFVRRGVSYTPKEEMERRDGGALRREQDKIQKQSLFAEAASGLQRHQIEEEQLSLQQERPVTGRDHREIERSARQQVEINQNINSQAKLPTQSKVRDAVKLLDEHIARLGGPQNPRAKPLVDRREEKLRDLKLNDLGHLPFASHLPDDPVPPGEQHLLQSENLNRTYSTVGTETGGSSTPHGRYAFAVRHSEPDRVYLGQSHHKLAEAQGVSYAGEAHFEDGELTRWNNDTGHYRTHPGFAHQAESATSEELGPPLLPREKFRPRHIDALRKKNLEKLAEKHGRSKSAMAQDLGISQEELAKVLTELDVQV